MISRARCFRSSPLTRSSRARYRRSSGCEAVRSLQSLADSISPRPISRVQSRFASTSRKRRFDGATIAHANCSRVSLPTPSRAVAPLISGNGHSAAISSPGNTETLTIISSISSGVAGMLLLAGTFSGFFSSIAAKANRSDCSNGWFGASWQRAHFISTPRNAVPSTCALAAIGTSFSEAIPKPAGPPSSLLPSIRMRFVTKRSIPTLSTIASWMYQRKGPLLLSVGFVRAGFSASTSIQ